MAEEMLDFHIVLKGSFFFSQCFYRTTAWKIVKQNFRLPCHFILDYVTMLGSFERHFYLILKEFGWKSSMPFSSVWNRFQTLHLFLFWYFGPNFKSILPLSAIETMYDVLDIFILLLYPPKAGSCYVNTGCDSTDLFMTGLYSKTVWKILLNPVWFVIPNRVTNNVSSVMIIDHVNI